jgi:VanZ family protein
MRPTGSRNTVYALLRPIRALVARRGPDHLSPLRAYVPALAWLLVVLYVGGREDVPSPATGLPLDKVAHFGMYGVLGLLLGRAWLRAGRRPAAALVIGAALLAGAFDELRQVGIATRSADALDWIMDALGVVLGFLAARRWGRGARTQDRS